MNRNHIILFSAFSLLLLGAPCRAELGLPETTFGQYVKKPGDGLYKPEAQLQRHPDGKYLDNTGCESFTISVPRSSQNPSRNVEQATPYIPAKALPVRDPSIEPITADEPIAQPGFPPMPNALDLPQVSSNRGWTDRPSRSSTARNNANDNGYEGSHQHYKHYKPGGFQNPPREESAAPVSESADAAAPESSTNYGTQPGTQPVQKSGYRVGTPTTINRYNGGGETYSTGTTGKGAVSVPTPGRSDSNGGQNGPSYAGVTNRNIKELGKAPELDKSLDDGPEAPVPAMLNQSPSQNLSLPDDESISGNFKNDRGKRFLKNGVKRSKQFGKNMLRSTGIPIGF